MNWKEELEKMLKDGCTDSDIADFMYDHPDVRGRDIWIFAYEYHAPAKCKGCKHISRSGGCYPCATCSRRIEVKDYYEPRED